MTTLNEAVTKVFEQAGTQLLFAGWVRLIRPHEQVIGLPASIDAGFNWVIRLDDRNPTLGPGSFDLETLKWWAGRANAIVVDAAPRHPEKSKLLGRAAAEAHGLLVIETTEHQRLAWHELLQEVGDVNRPAVVMAFRDGNAPGMLHFALGSLETDFSSDPPPFPGHIH